MNYHNPSLMHLRMAAPVLPVVLAIAVSTFAQASSVKSESKAKDPAAKTVAIVNDSTAKSTSSVKNTVAKPVAAKSPTAAKDAPAKHVAPVKDTVTKSVSAVRDVTAKAAIRPEKPAKEAAAKTAVTGKDSSAMPTATAKDASTAKAAIKPEAPAKEVTAKPKATANDSVVKPAASDKVGAVAAATAKTATTALPPVKAEVSSQTTSEDRYPKQAMSFPEGVSGFPDLTYATFPGFRPLTLDLYLPSDSMSAPASGFPLVVHIHGGGWTGGHARHAGAFANFPRVLASLATRGYVVASVNYRLSGEAQSPAAVIDIKTAVRWLRSKAAEYRIDPKRAAIWGGSAGGQLAGLVAVTCGVRAFDPDPDGVVDGEGRPLTGALPADVARQSDCVQAAVTWYGIFDFTTLRKHAGVKSDQMTPGIQASIPYLGCDPARCPPGLAKGASSTLYIDRNDPPMLLIHGTSDKIVPYQQSEDMAEKLKKDGVPATLLLIDGVGHGFVGPIHQKTTAASLKALNATFDFFDKTIGPMK